jgi:hypothetical protein
MSLNAAYLPLAIILILITLIYYILSIVEKKGSIHLFPFSMRKQFLQELIVYSEIAKCILGTVLKKNEKRDEALIFIVGAFVFAMIILETKYVPLNLYLHPTLFGIVQHVNFFSIVLLTDIYLIVSSLFLPLLFYIRSFNYSIEANSEKQMNKTVRFNLLVGKAIKFYHFGKGSRWYSLFIIIGFFAQSFAIEFTPYFANVTNIFVSLLPFYYFILIAIITIYLGRLRIALLYALESELLLHVFDLPAEDRVICLKTRNNSIFSDNLMPCVIESIGPKLEISYEISGTRFQSDVNWKDIAGFGMTRNIKSTDEDIRNYDKNK